MAQRSVLVYRVRSDGSGYNRRGCAGKSTKSKRLVEHWGRGAYGEIDGKTWADVQVRLDELPAGLCAGIDGQC